MKKSLLISIVIIITAALFSACGGGGTRPSPVKQTKIDKKQEISSIDNAVQKIANFFTVKEYKGKIINYTSKDFKEPEELTKAIQVINISNKDFSYTKLLQDEILARNKNLLQDSIDQKIFNFTIWYDQKAAKNGASKQGILNLTERENLDRINKIAKDNYPIDYWDEIYGKELVKIKTDIKAEDLYRTNSNYFVRYYWANGIGLDNIGVEWQTNMLYIGEVKLLNKESIRQKLYSQQSFIVIKEENSKRMEEYKDETKKVYEQNLNEANKTIKKIEGYEKLGGPLIPQGTVIYNDTGKEYKPRITSYANPALIGVFAPVQNFEEGQQDLYSYDATAFGSMSLADRNYVQLGTPKGSVFFNIKEGFLEYGYDVPNIGYKMDKNNQFGKVMNVSRDKMPDFVKSANFILNYDIDHDLSWGVNVDRNRFSKPEGKWKGGGTYFYTIYTNLSWIAGYNYNNVREIIKQKRLVEITTFFSFNIVNNKYYYGSLQIVGTNVYLGNLMFYGENELKGHPVYIYISGMDSLLWINTNNWKYSEALGRLRFFQEDDKIYLGIPSFFGLPYAYDWNINTDKEENLWIDIYPIQGEKALKRISIKNLKIGDKIKEFMEKTETKRKLTSVPEVKYIRFISDDPNGLIYFDVKMDMELYDFAPLIMAINREGNLKLLARLWSAAGDKLALKDSARMGPGFYDYRAVLTADSEIFTIWNGSKGVGIGKVEMDK